jgi:hypothetical protein
MLRFFKYFRQKIREKKIGDFDSYYRYLGKEDHIIGLQEKRHFFVENCDRK